MVEFPLAPEPKKRKVGWLTKLGGCGCNAYEWQRNIYVVCFFGSIMIIGEG